MKHFFTTLLIFFVFNLYAQKTPVIDLSKDKPDETTIDLGVTGFKIINKIPKGTYRINVSVEEEPLMLGKNSNSAGSATGTDTCSTRLAKYEAAYNNLLAADDEKKVPGLIDSLKKEQKNAIKDSKDCYDKSTKKADDLIKSTEEIRGFDFMPKKNQNITVTIERLNPETGVTAKSWTVILRTVRTVNYITHFGFTFSPNIVKPADQYFSKSDTGSTYIITKLNDNGNKFWEDLSLTANFVFPFNLRKAPASDFHFSWVAGFGLSGGGKFSIFTGPGFLVSDFFATHIAFGAYNQKKLKGEFEPGQRIKENLNFDQLHNSGIRPTVLLSFSFRFSKKQLETGSVEQ